MPTTTYTPIASITLAATATEVSFSSIPSGYRDLILVANFSVTSTGQVVELKINGSSSGTMVGMRGNGSTTASYSVSTMYLHYAGGTTSGLEIGIAQILDYSATDKHKTILVRSDNAASKSEAMANRWASTSAVTSVAVAPSAGSFTIGSTFNLFGIVA
jgi:hypothetical protein